MHHKIFKHLLSLFFVLVLLTAMSLQWTAVKSGQAVKEIMKKEAEHYKHEIPNHTEKNLIEVKMY